MTREERYKHYYNEGYNAGCVKGYEQAIDKACEWIHTALYLDYERSIEHRYASMEELINDFRKAMKGDGIEMNTFWKDAQGNELPDYDREVVVLIQDYPDDEEHLRVAFGHRPNPNGYVTKDGEKLYPMTYGKGGWNGKNVRYWLDVELPNQC